MFYPIRCFVNRTCLGILTLAFSGAIWLTAAGAAHGQTWAQSYGARSFDQNGVPIDSRTQGSGYDCPTGLARMPDGGFVVAGQLELPEVYLNVYTAATGLHTSGALVRYAADGTVLWQTMLRQDNDRTTSGGTFEPASSHVHTVLTDTEGNIFVCGGKGSPDNGGQIPFAAKFNAMGELIWQRGISAANLNPYGVTSTAALTRDGGVLVTLAQGLTAQGGSFDPGLAKLNNDGSLAFHAVFDQAYQYLAMEGACESATQDNIYVAVAGNGFGLSLLRIDGAGKLLSIRDTRDVEARRMEAPLKVMPTADGGFATLSKVGQYGTAGVVLRKFSESLEPVFEKLIQRRNAGFFVGDDLVAEADGGFLISGRTNAREAGGAEIFPGGGGTEAAILRVSAAGNLEFVSVFGGPKNEGGTGIQGQPRSATYVVRARDGGYGVTTSSHSFGTETTPEKADWWTVKSNTNRGVANFTGLMADLPLEWFTIADVPDTARASPAFTRAPVEVASATTSTVPGFILKNLASNLGINRPDVIVQAAPAAAQKKICFDAGSYTATEGGSVQVVVRRGADSSGPVSVEFTVGGTATPSGQPNSDFIVAAPSNLKLDFQAGEFEKTIFVSLSNDPGGEPDETVILTLGTPVGDAVLGTPAATTLTIKDTETANSGLSVTPPESRTTGLPWTFTVTNPSTASGLKLRVQSALAVGNQATWAWEDLPGSGAMTRSGNTWSLTTISIPVGARSFRSIASATGVSDSISAPTAVFNVAQGKILRLVAKAKSASDSTGATTRPGEVLNYELRYYNTSAAPATNVVVSASTPEATDFDTAQGDWRITTNGVKWKLGTVPAYSAASVFFSVRVSSKARVDTDIGLLQATISGNQNGAALPVTRATPVRSLVQSLFVVSAATTATEAGPGGLVTYTFTVRNDSGASMRDVKLSYKIENGSAVSAVFLNSNNQPTGSPIAAPGGGRNPGIDARGETVTWYFGKLPPLSVRHVRLKVRVWYDLPLNKPLLGGALTGTYRDADDRLRTSSPKFAPELAPTGIAPSERPHLAFIKEVVDRPGPNDDPDFVQDPDLGIINAAQPGATLSLQLYGYNRGSVKANKVVLKDRLPEGTELVQGSMKINNQDAGGRFNTEDRGKTLLFSVGDLAPVGFVTVNYQVRVLKKSDLNLPANAIIKPVGSIIESVGANIATSDLGATPRSVPTLLRFKVVAPVNLMLSKPLLAFPAESTPGEETQYFVGYRNEGGALAREVTLTAELPSNATLVDAEFLAEEPGRSIDTSSPGKVIFRLNQVGPEEEGGVHVIVKTEAGAEAAGVLKRHNFAVVFAHSKSDPPAAQPDSSPAAGPQMLSGGPAPRVKFTEYNRIASPNLAKICIVRYAPQRVTAFSEFEYLITVGNQSDIVTHGMVVAFVIPKGAEYVSSTAWDGATQIAGGSGRQGVFEIYFDSLGAHASKTVVVKLRATSAGQESIVDSTCYVSSYAFSQEFAPVLAGTSSTYVDPLVFTFKPSAPTPISEFLNAYGSGAENAIVDLSFSGNVGKATANTGSIVVGGADFIQIYAGAVVIPLRGGNVIAVGPPNIISGGAGNVMSTDGAGIVAGGAGNLVNVSNLIGQDGAGFANQNAADLIANIVAGGAGNIVAGGAGNIVAGGAGNLLSYDGAFLLGNDGSTFPLSNLNPSIIAGGAGNIVAGGAGNVIWGRTGGLILIGGAALIGDNGSILISNDASRAIVAGANGSIIAGGAGNIISGGAGNIISGGAGNIVAGGAGN